MKKGFMKLFILCGVMVPVGVIAQQAQQAKHVRCGECRQGPKFISQLPLEPTAVRLQFPAIFLETHGKWRAMNDQGKVIKYEGCVGYGPCVSYSKEESTSACAVGYINLALHLGLVKPGRYNLQWVPDNGDTVIGPISLIIQEPEGIDKEVYENILLPAWKNPIAKSDWGGWLSGVYTRGKSSIFSTILEKFSNSAYAGFALIKKVPDYSNPLFKPVPPQQQVKMSRDEGKTVVTFSDKAFEKYFKQLDAFMKGSCVPDSVRIRLYCYYGDLLVQRGRFQEAEEAFKKAVLSKPQNEEDKAYFKRAQAFLTALKAKSPCRKIVEKGKD